MGKPDHKVARLEGNITGRGGRDVFATNPCAVSPTGRTPETNCVPKLTAASAPAVA